jgi:hypothetical protein
MRLLPPRDPMSFLRFLPRRPETNSWVSSGAEEQSTSQTCGAKTSSPFKENVLLQERLASLLPEAIDYVA